MPRRNDDYQGGGSGWRFGWRIDRLQKLHELGQAFGLTEDARRADDEGDDRELDPHDQSRKHAPPAVSPA